MKTQNDIQALDTDMADQDDVVYAALTLAAVAAASEGDATAEQAALDMRFKKTGRR